MDPETDNNAAIVYLKLELRIRELREAYPLAFTPIDRDI
jgi:hypothetical protein